MYNAANNASSQLAQAISASDTSLTVLDGSSFPEPPFVVSIEDEIIEVGSKSGNTFSALVRGLEGTTPASHPSGARVENRFTAGTYQQMANELDTHINELITQKEVHGIGSESGLWTPQLGGSSLLGTTVYTEQQGTYYKIGDLVYINAFMKFTSMTGGSGYFIVTGLPFVPALSYKFYLSVAQNFDTSIGNIADTHSGNLYLRNNTGLGAVSYRTIGEQKEIRISGVYRIEEAL